MLPVRSLLFCPAQPLAYWAGKMRMMVVARTPVGRALKVFLFIVGAVLPLGSLIWALLLWHGLRSDESAVLVSR